MLIQAIIHSVTILVRPGFHCMQDGLPEACTEQLNGASVAEVFRFHSMAMSKQLWTTGQQTCDAPHLPAVLCCSSRP